MTFKFTVGQTYNVIDEKGARVNKAGVVAISERENKGVLTPDMDLEYIGKAAKDTPQAGHHMFKLPEGVEILGETTIAGVRNHFDFNAAYVQAKKNIPTKGTLQERADEATRQAEAASDHAEKLQRIAADLRVEILCLQADEQKAAEAAAKTQAEIDASWDEAEAQASGYTTNAPE
jgi:hypothetical protein